MTASARFEELANLALDGAATPAERTELDLEIARDPAAREQWARLQATFAALGSLTPPEPPADLKPAIMRAIHSNAADAGPRPRPSWSLLRMVTTFAAGAAAGILVWTMATGPRAARELPTSGTMMPPTAGATIDRTALDAGGARVDIETRDRAGNLEVHLRGHANGAAELVIEHGTEIEPAGVDGVSGSSHQVAFAPGRTTIAFASELGCAITFHGTDASRQSLRVTLRSESRFAQGVLQGKR